MPLRREPARALPVPFWRYIFLVVPATSPRLLVLAVPSRRFDWYMTTTSCSNCLLIRGARSVGVDFVVADFLARSVVHGQLGNGRLVPDARSVREPLAARLGGRFCSAHGLHALRFTARFVGVLIIR